MLHFSYESGDIAIVNTPRQTFSLTVVFFFDEKMSLQQMHLLDHLMLHPKRKMENGEITLQELTETCPSFKSHST